MSSDFNPNSFKPRHFIWEYSERVGEVTFNRPEKKNPLTFEAYAELRDLFRAMRQNHDLRVVVLRGAGGNFCSGGDVHEIIGPLTAMSEGELLKFTQMTGDLIKAIRNCPQIVISAVEGICAGAGAAIAMASDLRIGSSQSKVAFLFVKVGLAGCDMGACSILPRIIGQGRATELLLSGRSMSAEQALAWGFYNEVVPDPYLHALDLARQFSQGPTYAYRLTKEMLNQEWHMGVDQAIDAEARAQAVCMQTHDFQRAYQAFCSKTSPRFEGN